jgi:hypothetical protein
MGNVIESKRILSELSTKAQEIVASKSFSNLTKKSMLDALALEQKTHQSVLTTHEQAQRLMVGGSALGSEYDRPIPGRAAKGLATPALRLTNSEQDGLFQAAKSGQNLTVSLKDATSSDATRLQQPAQYIGLVDRRFEPTRILDHIPTSGITAPSVEFISHTANTVGIAAPVITLGSAAAGGTFTAGAYYWKLTATNVAGETLGSNELSATLTANQSQPINWTAITGANGYRLYRGTVAGAENVLVTTITSGATVTYTDTGTAGTNASLPALDRTAGAATVHAGAAMPEISLTTVATILQARKIAVFTTVVDEVLSDFPTFSEYVDVELTREVTNTENNQILNGDGTGDNLLGLLRAPGTLSRAKGSTDAALDVLEQGITDLRNGPSFCEPDALIIHPSTWSTIRRTKNSLGNYILGDPGQTTVNDVWGVPVLQTTQCQQGVIVLANLEIGAQAFIREGMVLTMTNSADADFTSGKVKIRTTERLTLGLSRPTAINILTGF